MPATQTMNGKAFEYACILSLYEKLHTRQDVIIEDSSALRTASRFFELSEEIQKGMLLSAANAAVRAILRLEPKLLYSSEGNSLYLSIQSDAQGMAGDVRDVLCVRRLNEWEIGFSCKHNHHAVKHSRLSDTINFGDEWFGIPCSGDYFTDVVPIFTELRNLRDDARLNGEQVLWSNIEDKNERYYVPILTAFMRELNRLAEANPNIIPERLIRYLIGRYDFYKIITDDSHRITTVEAMNLSGTLNKPEGANVSIVNTPRLKLPTRFYYIGFKPDSKTTIDVVCDEGWTVSMRIHSAKSEVEPSLKFDINLVSLPASIHSQVEPW